MSPCNYAPQSYSFCINCPKCQKKVKKIFSTGNGVYTMKVGAEKVTIKKEQENSSKALKTSTPNEQNNQHKPPVCAGNGDGQSTLRGCDVADLKELAKTKNLKQLEFTQTTDSRNLRMSFKEENDDEPPQKGPHEGTEEEPKKEDEQNVGHGPCHNESVTGTGQPHVDGCPHSECDPIETIEGENPCDYAGLYNGPHHTPHYHHPWSHYHGYHHHYHYPHPPNSQPLLTPHPHPQAQPLPEPHLQPPPPPPPLPPSPSPSPPPPSPPSASPQPRANCQYCRDIMSRCVIM